MSLWHYLIFSKDSWPHKFVIASKLKASLTVQSNFRLVFRDTGRSGGFGVQKRLWPRLWRVIWQVCHSDAGREQCNYDHTNLQTEVQRLHRCLRKAARDHTHWRVSPIQPDRPVQLVSSTYTFLYTLYVKVINVMPSYIIQCWLYEQSMASRSWIMNLVILAWYARTDCAWLT